MLETVRIAAGRAFFEEGFDTAEEVVNGAPLPEEAKAALWLWIWSLQDRSEQLRTAEAYVLELADVHD